MQHGRSCGFMLLFQLLLCSIVGDARPVAGMMQYLADLIKGQITGKTQVDHSALGLIQGVDSLIQCNFLRRVLHDIVQSIGICDRFRRIGYRRARQAAGLFAPYIMGDLKQPGFQLAALVVTMNASNCLKEGFCGKLFCNLRIVA